MALAACGGGASPEGASEVLEREDDDAAANASVQFDGDDGRTVEFDAGALSFEDRVPDSWPADVPLPDGLQVTVGGEVGNAQGAAITVSGHTSMSADDLDAFYAGAMDDWSEIIRYDTGDSINIGYQHGARMLQINVTASGDETTLTLSYLEESTDELADEDDSVVAPSNSNGDLTEALDQIGLEAKGDAILTAAGADRYEVDGETLHIYFGDSAGVPEGLECMVIAGVLSEGESAVAHRDGNATRC